MVSDIIIYSGDLERSLRKPGPPDVTGDAAKVSSHILSLYHTGEPLFSKELVRHISRELKAESQKVSVRGLDGVVVDFDIETRQVFDNGESDWDYLIGAPFIFYFSIQWCASQVLGFVPRIAYCSVWIFHHLQKRDRKTKELISTVPRRSQEEVEEFFRTNQQAWECSEQRGQLQSIISTKVIPHIKKIVAFSCGGMNFYDELPWAAWSAYQHALIITLRDFLSEQQKCDNIECYAQDPIYTDIDREVLGRLGITVLDDPQGFLELDDSTAVLSFSSDIPVRQIVTDIAQPAMMIWDRIEFWEDELTKPFGTDPDSPRLTKMIQSFYEGIEFPGDLEAFKHTSIYVRRGTYS